MRKYLLAMVLMPLFCASAATETVDGITWTYTLNNGTACVGAGSSWHQPAIASSTKGAITIPATLGERPVTSIGDDAFCDCRGLTSVTIPSSVTSIGSYAFYNCSGLTSVTIPPSVRILGSYVFYGCCGLTSVTIPMGVTSIGDDAFFACSGLASVEIPSSVTSIGNDAFYCCVGLTSVTIPSSVKSIGWGAFYYCSGLTSVTIPSSVSSIGSGAFSGCDGLMSVTIPACVTRLSTTFPTAYTNIMTVVILDGQASIGASAFYGCSGLKSVTMPSSVTSIGEKAFYCCSGLTSVTIPSGVTNIGERVFYGCSGLTSVTIPSGVTSIGSAVFSGCSGLDVVNVMYGDHGDIDSVKGLYAWPSRIVFVGMLTDPIFVPGSGAVFDSSLKVSITNAVAGAAIYYTMDGTDPTTNSTPYKKFLLDHKATIKAIAAYKGVTSGVVTAHYAKGKVEDPVITADADLFDHSGNVIGISCPTPSAVIHYTTDGSVPTAESPVYERPFAIDDTTTVRAIAAEHPDYFDSEIVTRTFVRKWEVVKTPVLQSYYGSVQSGTPTTELRGSYLSVVMSCATEGAVIHFTTNGADPTTGSPVYEGPFKAYDTMTIRAIAVKDDWKDSPVAEIRVTKFWTIGDSLNLPDQGFTMEGIKDWVTDHDVSHDGVASMRSEEVSHNQKTSLNTEFTGSGRLSFWWKSSAEDWDGGQLFVDGVSQAEIFGETDWKNVAIDITGNTTHVISWVYAKDETESGGSDCIWLDQIVWASIKPTIDDDPKATVTGDAESGFVIKPSEGKTTVEVAIPQGVDAAKVTVEISPKVASVKPNGAKVTVVNGSADITEFLNVPAADEGGAIDLTKATVKEEIVKEAMDVGKGAKIELNAANPSLTTPNTRVGLFYQLREGVTIEGMSNGDSTIGDGKPWSPEIKVKGGNSAFYSIVVGKGE